MCEREREREREREERGRERKREEVGLEGRQAGRLELAREESTDRERRATKKAEVW